MVSKMDLKKTRQKAEIPVPQVLQKELRHVLKPASTSLQKEFPHTYSTPEVRFIEGARERKAQRVGVLFSGGPAAGGHNVIAGLHEGLPKGSILVGFLMGSAGLIENKSRVLSSEEIAAYRNLGGFDQIGTGRTKIETPEQFASSLQTVLHHQLDGLVVIGGDDSNTNAALLADYFIAHNCSTIVVGVPKTIDGDLKNQEIEQSFGFDTACKMYANTIGSLMSDLLSSKKLYFFVKLMGRSASHVTLECALQTHPNLALIAEEIREKKQTLTAVVDQIVDMIVKRASQGKNYGILLIPEGIIEFLHGFDPSTLEKEMKLERDPHGNIQVSKIKTERFLIQQVEMVLKKRGDYKGTFSPQPIFLGYEARSTYPSLFDSAYCYALGRTAALLVEAGITGVMSVVQWLDRPVAEWQIGGIPLVSMIHHETRKGILKPVIAKALVDLKGAPFRAFETLRAQWIDKDDYRNPGPIQLFGPDEIAWSRTKTLSLSS